MNTRVPDYYYEFKCTSKDCKHNCCIGWEIEIDEITYSVYSEMNNDFGKKIREGINHTSVPCFKKDKEGRCAFLTEEGLCKIILNLGEDYLCDVCYDHPRFRNFYSSFTEIGLGLCCEEAARVILNNQNKVKLINETNEEFSITKDEKIFLNKRNEIFDIIQNRSIPFNERLKNIERKFSLNRKVISPCDFARFYYRLERLDDKWDSCLDSIKNASEFKITNDMNIVLEQLFVYLIFRHLSVSLYDNNFNKRLAFCIHAVEFISTIYHNLSDKIDFNKLCRMYSCEIEYSDENLTKLIELM